MYGMVRQDSLTIEHNTHRHRKDWYRTVKDHKYFIPMPFALTNDVDGRFVTQNVEGHEDDLRWLPMEFHDEG